MMKLFVKCDGLSGWIEKTKIDLDKRGFETEAKVWTGKDMVKMLAEEPSRITSSTLALYKVIKKILYVWNLIYTVK